MLRQVYLIGNDQIAPFTVRIQIAFAFDAHFCTRLGTRFYFQLDFIPFPETTVLGVALDRALPCAIALSINSSAYVAEVIRSGIQAVDSGQGEAARSLGMTQKQAMLHIIMPQAIKNILPAIGNEFVTMIKETSIIQYLGVSDLMYNNGIVITATYNPLPCYYISAIIYLVLNIVLGKGINIFERRLQRSDRK